CGAPLRAPRRPREAKYLREKVEDLLEAFEQMHPLLDRLELVLQPARDHLETEMEEVPQDGLEIQPLRPPHFRVLGGSQTGEVHRESGLQRRVLVEVRH